MRSDEIRRVTVIGAGLMGHGVAQELGVAGYDVHLLDCTEEITQKALTNIQEDLERLLGFGLVTVEQVESARVGIQATTVMEEAVKDTDLVIEAVYEDLALKQKVF